MTRGQRRQLSVASVKCPDLWLQSLLTDGLRAPLSLPCAPWNFSRNSWTLSVQYYLTICRKNCLDRTILSIHCTIPGVYASFLKRQRHKGIFFVVKGTLWGNCKFTGEFQWHKGIDQGAQRQLPSLPLWIIRPAKKSLRKNKRKVGGLHIVHTFMLLKSLTLMRSLSCLIKSHYVWYISTQHTCSLYRFSLTPSGLHRVDQGLGFRNEEERRRPFGLEMKDCGLF